jgi:3-hydroxyisobutyrate dehydrogenase-like beta-hydroxyacid dehydrogenase
MKLVVNLVLGLNRAVLAEGLAFAHACGLDLAQTLKVLQAGAAYSRVMETKGRKMIERDCSQVESPASHRRRLPDLNACKSTSIVRRFDVWIPPPIQRLL